MFNLLKKSKKIVLSMPFAGEVININEVPDQVFSQKMLGDGFAIFPKKEVNIVKSPCACKLLQIFPTNHALGFELDYGIEIILHIGIDTVELKGNGFKRIINPPALLKKGDQILEFDGISIEENGKSIVTPIVFTEASKIKEIRPFYGWHEAGEPCCEIELK